MASKIEDKSLYVGITPYEHEGQTYDVLNVTAGYRKGRGFYVNVHPGWKSDFGFGCMFDFSQNPLSDATWVDVMAAPKNSQKTIDAMHANLRAETAQKIIRLLFDQRMWSALKTGLKHIALNSQWATEELLAALSKNNNNQNSSSNNKEDESMKLNLSNQNNETKNAAKQQVTNNEPIVKQVDVMGLMGALSRDGHAKLSDHVIEDAEAVEVKDEQADEIASVNVGEVTLATIMPKMTAEPEPTKQEVAEAIVKAATTGEATTKPLGKHGTLVIASGGGDKAGKPQGSKVQGSKVQGSSKPTAKPAPETCNVKPETLSKVTLVTYTTKRGETAPRIIGFSGEDDPRWKPIHDEKQALIAAYNKAKKKDPKAKMTSSPFGPAWLSDREGGSDEKTYCMTLGVKYMDVAKALCAAYNTNDRDQWAKAEQAVRDQKAGIAAGYQAEREAKRAARQAAKANDNANKPATPAMSNEEQAMFELFKKFMKGDKAAMAQVNEVLKAA